MIQRSDLAYANALIHSSTSFVAKLHGSISAVETTVFATEDYQRMVADESCLFSLQQLFSTLSLVVIGSSMSDDYLLTMLHENATVKKLFGDGPHFLITPSSTAKKLPGSFRAIRYDAHSAVGHRAAIHVLENVAPEHSPLESSSGTEPVRASAYFLIDLFPPNVPWTSAITTRLDSSEPSEVKSIVRGLGFCADEVPANSTTLHDVLVALTCFEKIYAPFETVPKFAYLLGGDLFAQLIKERALEFIWWEAEEGVSFTNDLAVTGGISTFVIRNSVNDPLTLRQKLSTIMQVVQVLPTQQDAFAKIVASGTTCIREDHTSPISATILHALRLPRVRRLLGFSRFVPHDVIPRWLAYPALRSARLVRAAETCRILKAASIKFPFGARTLGNTLLAMPIGAESADNIANYLLYGSFKPSLPSSLAEYRSVVRTLLRFRATPAAERHRTTILRHLSMDAGADCAAAIDATLRTAIPTAGMQECHDQLSEFLISDGLKANILPALWAESVGDPISRWHARAQNILRAHCSANNLSLSDSCPCGSSMPLRDCCFAALDPSASS